MSASIIPLKISQLALLVSSRKHISVTAALGYIYDSPFYAKLYDEENCVDLDKQLNNPVLSNERVAHLMKSEKSWGDAWIECDRVLYHDEHFIEVLDYLKANKISN